MLFEKDSPAVEFQTYHCLYTLALAGYSPEQPQVAKSLKFLLERQQEWGGWFDPKQSYENFRTPFRETQFAVMALSEFYKGKAGKGWQSPSPQRLNEQDVRLKRELLSSKYSEAQIAALDRIKALGDDRKQFDADVKTFVLNANSKVAPAALRSLSSTQKRRSKTICASSACWSNRLRIGTKTCVPPRSTPCAVSNHCREMLRFAPGWRN